MSQQPKGPEAGGSFKVAVVTVGVHVAPGAAALLARELEAHGHVVASRASSGDDPQEVQRLLREAIEDPGIHAIILVGGSGLGRSETMMESVEPFVEKPVPGFGEAMRALCRERWPAEGILLRGEAFVSETKLVFCIPGREDVVAAVAEGLIGPVLANAVREARG